MFRRERQNGTHRARNPGKQLNKKSTYGTFFESAENSAPLLPRTCMFYKLFSDDQEMATNQKNGLCDYLRTKRDRSRTILICRTLSPFPLSDLSLSLSLVL
eukprot:COSAG05_NODE_8498_length_698_cov_47.492487_1_plen_100_part_01